MRKTNRFYTILFLAVILIAACLFIAFSSQPVPSKLDPRMPIVPFEIPRVRNGQPEQVIPHVGYTVSYNPHWLVPNWVAYELTRKETLGTEERADHFKPDPVIKNDPVTTSDYARSGYDRGHMAPAADMKWSEQAMRESFYMTNICPQMHGLNAGDWKDLEELARSWAQQYGNIYIACGPIVEPGYKTIGNTHKIAVPSAFYKVFLRFTSQGWTSIGFVMPNQAGSRPLMTYLRTVDEVEELTGIDFFYHLPDSIQQQVESTYSLSAWSLSRH